MSIRIVLVMFVSSVSQEAIASRSADRQPAHVQHICIADVYDNTTATSRND
jgi:hypothetical protein